MKPLKNVGDRALIKMLSCLDSKQLKGFAYYLNCPLFNTNPTLIRLFDYLVSRAFNPRLPSLSQPELLEDTGIAPGMVDKLFSQTLSHLNRFVSIWENKNNQTRDHGRILTAWHRMGLSEDLLDREYHKMKRKQPKNPASEGDIFYILQLENSYSLIRATQPRHPEPKPFESHLQLIDSFYLIAKLKYLCASLNAGRVFQEKDSYLEDIISKLSRHSLPPVGEAFYQSWQLLNHPNPGAGPVQELLLFLEKESASFLPTDRSDLYTLLLNSSIRGMTQGKANFEHLVDRIYAAMLRHELLTRSGRIPGSHFKNIVSIKVRVGKLDEAQAFIESYQSLLPEAEKDILLAYTQGLLCFHRKDYRQAIVKFRGIVRNTAEDLFWGLEARNMLWKSYFEGFEDLKPEEHEEMLNLYHSFRQYVARNTRVSTYHKSAYENFIRIFNRLIQVGDQKLWVKTVPDLENLLAETTKTEPIVHKKWLLAAIAKKIARG